MCGICGFSGLEDKALLERMTELIRHRGPDDVGFHSGEQISLGHARLSIIDLSAAGRQPLSNEDGTVQIVCNGEIYNFRELKERLIRQGHQFRSQCDTEVVIHAYEEAGARCLEWLNGCFALALWDGRKRRLLLARDRLGIRPLYYALAGASIVFASEVKSILLHPDVSREIDFASLDQYLSLRYVPGDSTMFKGIKRLPPASTLSFDDGKVEISRFWRLAFSGERRRSEEDYVDEFSELLEDSVRLRLMSDVPLGMFLSGGVDSGAILGLMSGLNTAPVRTFSIGFGDEVDELSDARTISRRFRTDHQEKLIESEAYDLLPEIAWHLDEPIGDAIVIPTFLLCRMAAGSVKVVLTGEGADEIMGGYVHQIYMHLGERYRRAVPSTIRDALLKVARMMPVGLLDSFFDYPAFLGEQGKQKVLRYLAELEHPGSAYLMLVSVFDRESKRALYSPEFYEEEIAPRDPWGGFLRGFPNGEGASLNCLIENDMQNWLPNYTLLKQDRLAAAHGLEGRVPFLDHRLVEFCASLPMRLKLKGLTSKYLLRKSADRILPGKRAWTKKRPFLFPVERCFGSDFDEYVRDLLVGASSRRRGIFNRQYLERLLQRVRSSEIVHNKQIMALVILENWFRVFVDGDAHGG